MSKFFAKPKVPALAPLPPLPDPNAKDEAAIRAEEAAREKEANRRGRASTILTGSDSNNSLLGG